MKRSLKSLIAALAAMAIFIGAYFLLSNWEPEEQVEEENDLQVSETVYIVDEDTENIDYVEFNTGEEIYLIRNGKTPSIEGYSSYVIDNSKLESALISSSSVIASKKLNTIGKLEDYGLDKEDRYVSIKLKDGTERKIIFGNSTNFEDEHYAKLKGEDAIYSMSSYIVNSLMKSPSEYRSLDMCQLDNTTIKAVSVEKQGKKEFSIILDEDFVPTSEYQSTSYVMTYPYKNVTASYDKLDELFSNISSLSATEIVEENPTNLSQYGLDKPYVISCTDDNGKNTVKMGSYTDDGNVYIMCNELPVVYSAACPFYENVKAADADEYIERFITLFNILDVESIEIASNEKTHNMLIKKKSEDKYEYSINGKIKTEENFKKLYQLVIGVTAAEFLQETPTGEEKCKITFKFTDGKQKTFTYYTYDDRYCIVKADNGMVCLALTKNIDKIFDELNKI